MLADLTIDLGAKEKRHVLKNKEDELRLVEECHQKVEAAYNETFERTVEDAYALDPDSLDFARNIKAFCDQHAQKTASIQHAHQTLPKEIDALKKELGIVEDKNGSSPCNKGDNTHCRSPAAKATNNKRSEKAMASKASELEEMEKDIMCMEEFLKECEDSRDEDSGVPKDDKTIMTMLDNLMQELEGLQDLLVDIMSSAHEQDDIIKTKVLLKRSLNVWKGAWLAAKMKHYEALRYDTYPSV